MKLDHSAHVQPHIPACNISPATALHNAFPYTVDAICCTGNAATGQYDNTSIRQRGPRHIARREHTRLDTTLHHIHSLYPRYFSPDIVMAISTCQGGKREEQQTCAGPVRTRADAASAAVDLPVDKFSIVVTSGRGVNMAGVVATTVARPEWVRPGRGGPPRQLPQWSGLPLAERLSVPGVVVL